MIVYINYVVKLACPIDFWATTMMTLVLTLLIGGWYGLIAMALVGLVTDIAWPLVDGIAGWVNRRYLWRIVQNWRNSRTGGLCCYSLSHTAIEGGAGRHAWGRQTGAPVTGSVMMLACTPKTCARKVVVSTVVGEPSATICP